MDVEEIKRVAREKVEAAAAAAAAAQAAPPAEPAPPAADDGLIKLIEPAPPRSRSKHQKGAAPAETPAENIPPKVMTASPVVAVLSAKTIAEQEAGRAAVERRAQRDAEAKR